VFEVPDMTTMWLPTSRVAELAGGEAPLSDRAIRKRVSQGKYGKEGDGWRRAQVNGNPNGIEIALKQLTPIERARLFDRHPHLAPKKPAIAAVDALVARPVFAFSNLAEGSAAQKRAIHRKTICDGWEIALIEWGDRGGITRMKARFCEQHEVTPRALDKWITAYRAYGIDGLVDCYDGVGRKPVVPQRVADFARARYTDGTIPTGAMTITEARVFAERELGVDVSHIADDAFYRELAKIPPHVIKATREDQDEEERWIFTLRRDHNFPAMHIVVADHHYTDRWVHCGEGDYVFAGDRLTQIPPGRLCGPEGCRGGHRVWITTFMDVASRRTLVWIVSLDYPNADTIRRAVRKLVTDFGIPNIIYSDNGKDFKSAFGKAVRRHEALPLNEALTENLLTSLGIRVIFAIPGRARSKNIERLFKTWCLKIWQGHPEYVGALGERTEAAEALRQSPHKLLSLAAFQDELTTAIDLYNTDPHRGQAMRGRSPREVFDATRIPRRDPDPHAFAYAFHTWYGRQVQPGGTLEVRGDRYRVDENVAGHLLGKNVQLLVDPDDVCRALVFSGCEHTTSKHHRRNVASCDCTGKSQFICDATLAGFAPYTGDRPLTRKHLDEANRINRTLRRQVREYSSETARQDLRLFAAHRPELLRAIRDERVAAHERRALASGESSPAPVTVMMPQSRMARQLTTYRERMSSLGPRQLPELDDSHLDRLMTNARPQLVANDLIDDVEDAELEAERARVRRHRKLLRGLCTEDECEEELTLLVDGAEQCGPHYLARFGEELEPEVRAQLEILMKEEE
jgi:hypothetical protein